MKFAALVTQSLASIWNNKGRSGLTILGIIIGIAAVIALVSLGKGLEADTINRLGSLDATAITVRSQDPEREQIDRGAMGRGVMTVSGGAENTLSVDDYRSIRGLEDVAKASPEAETQVGVALTEDAQTATSFQALGIDTDYVDIKKLNVVEGTNLSESQVSDSENVILIGKEAAGELFPDETSFVGKIVYIDDDAYEIVGVVEAPEVDTSNMPVRIRTADASASIFTGYNNWLTLADEEKLPTITLTASETNTVAKVASVVESLLLEAHDITDENKADFGIMVNQDILNTLTSTANNFSATLTGIAAISLVVGGIGIMNIMLVTVTERTREIGLRRAVGAKTKHILTQFLTESLLLTMVGGILGLLLGIGASNRVGELLNYGPGRSTEAVAAIVDIQTVILAVGIAAAVGIVFGLFPAIKAAKLDPVEALRYE